MLYSHQEVVRPLLTEDFRPGLRSSGDADRSNDEFAGSTFSPCGSTLFVNIQASRGMSFAIWGPWSHLGV